MVKIMLIYIMYNYFFILGIFDLVVIGGMENVRLLRVDYDYVKAFLKFIVMVFRLVNKFFLKEILLNFILYGMKEYVVFDSSRIVVIKGKLRKVELLSVCESNVR